MSQELKPCPFCGAVATVEESINWYAIACSGCSAFLEEPTEKEAIEAWNRRVQSDLAKVQEQEQEIVRLTAEAKRYREALEAITSLAGLRSMSDARDIAKDALREGKGEPNG